MNAIPSPFKLSLLVFALGMALAGCKDDAPVEVASPPTVEPTPTPAPAETDIKPATGAIEATDENIAAARKSIEEAADAARRKWVGKTFEEFEATVYKEPGDAGNYIVSGDIAIPDRKLLQEFFEKMQKETDGVANGKLTVGVAALTVANTTTGGVDIWTSARKKQLGYCVSDDFAEHKAAVLADMQSATRTWEEAANVDFIHVAGQDGDCTASNQNVVFDVRPIDVQGQYLARAFFPSDQRSDRNVLIDNTSFELPAGEPLQLVGILRHELGHALGLRHEHTRPEAGMCFEDANVVTVTAYDKFSVMHYPQCNGGGDWSLVLTGLDKAGSACLYGKGSNNPENLDQCTYRAPDAPTTGVQETKTFANQSVSKGEKKRYGPFPVKPGSLASVVMTGEGNAAGDPDLYVRYSRQPEADANSWNCRPYLSHANETCELEVPGNRNRIYVMVRGYAAGSYKLAITFTKPD